MWSIPMCTIWYRLTLYICGDLGVHTEKENVRINERIIKCASKNIVNK